MYADRQALPDVNMLAQDIDDAVTELLAGTYRVMQSAGSLLTRARAAAVEDERPSRPQPFKDPIRAERDTLRAERDSIRAEQDPIGAERTTDQIEREQYDLELQRLANDGRAPT